MFRIAYLSVAFSIFGATSAFLINALAAKYLGPTFYGQAIHLVNISGLVSILITFGFQYHFSNSQKNNELKDNELHKSFSLMLFGAVAVGIFLVLLSPGRLPNYVYFFVIIHSVLYVMVEKVFFFRIATGKAISAAFYRSFMAKSAALVAFLIIYYFSEGQNGLILLAANMIGYSLVLLFHRRYFKFTHVDSKYLDNVRTYYFVQLVYYLPSFLLRISFAYVAGYVALSYMMISIVVSQSVTMIATAMTNQFSPKLRTHYLSGDFIAFKNILTESIIIPSKIIVPAIIFVAFNAQHMYLFLGEQYNQDLFYIMLCIVLIGAGSNALTGMTGTALLMSGKQNIEFFIGTVKAFVALITFIIFYYYIPDLSAPIAIMSSEVTANILKLLMVQREFKIWVLDSKIIINLAYQIAVYSIVFACVDLSMEDGVWKVYITATMAFVLFIVGFLKKKIELYR